MIANLVSSPSETKLQFDWKKNLTIIVIMIEKEMGLGNDMKQTPSAYICVTADVTRPVTDTSMCTLCS